MDRQAVNQTPAGAEALRIIDVLSDAGFHAVLAGGCVRDGLLGRRPKDYDVATDATPPAVRRLFGHRRTLAFGASFGVIGVLPEHSGDEDAIEDDGPKTGVTEVATFRSDGDYHDGRRPDAVTFGDARADAVRRDFTINGLFFDPARDDSILDYVGGHDDLRRRVVRAIGDPHQRFAEDHLRLLRAVRFATTLAFDVEPDTLRAVRDHADDLSGVSAERIGAEMRRILGDPNAPRGLSMLFDTGLSRRAWPSLNAAAIETFADRWSITPTNDPVAATAMMLADNGFGDDAVDEVTGVWRLSNAERRRIEFALQHYATIALGAETPWSTLQPIVAHPRARDAIDLATAICAADELSCAGLLRCTEALRWPESRLDPSPLITGEDLRSAGMTPGPEFKAILAEVRRRQLDGELLTRREAMAWALG